MSRKSSVLSVVAQILLLLAASEASVRPQIVSLVDLPGGVGVSPDLVGAGSLLIRSDISPQFVSAPTVETNVRIDVTGLIGRARVEQVFRNPTDEWVEGVYVFPLPERAAVDTLRMVIGARVIEGQIQEKEKARKTYRQARREGRKASLVEQERPNIFSVSVSHIGPKEEIRIHLEYQEDVHYEAGRFELRFPMVVAPRYVPGEPGTEQVTFSGTGWAGPTDVVPDADRITPPTIGPRAARSNLVDLEVELNAGMPLAAVESSSHRARVEQRAGFRYVIRPGEGALPADRDFTLSWKPDVGTAPKATLFTEEIDGETYILLMLLPPEKASDETRLPRETIFFVDTSGSMHGSSMEQASRALLEGLDRLGPDDSFNVIQFNKRTSKLFAEPVPADGAAIARARDYVSGLEASGGTEMMSALTTAFGPRSPGETHRVRQIIFITDGSVGNEAQLFSHIHDHLGERRLFTVGIGSAPNTHFMSKAAKFGRGTFTYIGAVSEVSERMSELFAKLESPVLSDITLDFEDDGAEVWPNRVPDLYVGEPIVITARLPKASSGLDVRARLGQEPWGMGFQLRGGVERTGVDKLWARRQIAELTDSIIEGADRDEVRQKVVDLALRHHLVSRFTSLVAVDVTTSAHRSVPVTKPVPAEIPSGWSVAPRAGTLPQGATSARLLAMLGFLALIFGLLIHWSSDTSCNEERSVFSSSR